MNTLKARLLSSIAVLAVSGAVGAMPLTNVAQNQEVILDGLFFNDVGSWSGSYPDNPTTIADQQAHADTVTDGVFLPDDSQWNDGTLWWDSHNVNEPQHVIIDLDDIFTIEGFVVQADDNDAYLLEYWDPGSGWVTAWDVPNFDAYGWGMQTRPNDQNNAEIYMLPTSIETNQLRFSGVDGDQYYSVSEIQAWGYASVPEPSSLVLLGAGMLGLAMAGRRKHGASLKA